MENKEQSFSNIICGRNPVMEAIRSGREIEKIFIKKGPQEGSIVSIIKKAKEMCKTFDAKLVVSGKLNFLAYCFRAKNYYGMVDKQEIEVAPSVSEQSIDAAAIRAKYLGNNAPPTLGDGGDEE